ncbi:AAA family ATPase [Escherichia coli]|uniref:type VI secretion IcmF C-terminal domain-containing protein n=1 Tax=Escherichia coli TaxID=562 RepID=UPI000BE84113|nr:type VI secretion IcmF C-terminal domain-containing protein [Escherichia coli]EFK8490227.1 AAA family ATPase [Escherichia coli]MED0439030.1 type VI secretion IcmF C-terminal domain-containing protein [Escherichia coli]GCG50468.1 ATP-dependent Clp proteinase [Escherichia coli]HDD9453624.1 AAA family ATPase [Escherichia coli]
MIQIDLPPLVKRLNLFSRQALEMAASECMSQQAAEITVSHVLIQMLAMPRSDLRVITRQGDIGMEELCQALTVENYTTARSADSYPAFSPMLVEWLKEGWLLASAEMQHSELRGGVLLLALLHSPLRYIPPAAARLLTGINRDRLQQDFVQWTQESAESVVPDADGKGAGTMTDASDTLLARYAKNMTADARNGRLDPVLCRDHEIDLMIDILCRRRKNNPVVVGEAGVGKSALIEGLALRIVAGQVPDKLKNTDIMTLDLGALQAGASVKGEFEKRFKGLMAEVISSPVPVILFIDEAHTLIGAGNQQGGLDISNLLKPALARGELKTIAATTWSEYKKYFEKDAALSRRFQLVKVSEPNAAEATIILRGLSAVYEQSHGVLIDDDALQAAATLSERYLSGRQLPDKAIDVLDTACARVAINLSSPPKQISALTTLSHQQEAEIRQLERELRIGLRTDTSRMTEQYISDYTATWRAGMDNLNIRNFESIGQLTGALEQVISGDQPLQRALTVLRDNTQPGVFSEKLSAKEREEALAEPDYQLLTRLGHEFAPENSTLAVQKDKESTMQAVYQQLTELHRYLLAIQNAPVPGKSALKAVQLRLDQNSSDPIFATRQMAKTLPAPLNRWVGRLTDQAWHVVMVEAVHYMEVDWRDSVVKPFNEQLANNYPFNPRSAQDASLDAFERFFKPDGILDTFYQQNLKLFIDNDLSLEDGDNNVIIREDIIAQLETAQKIRDIFFSKQNGLGTSFAVETVSLSGNKRRSVLNLDGQLVDYSQGRNYTAHLVWPNNMREGNESKLTLIGTSGNAPRSISFSGPWAQFRLFGAGQLTGVQDGNFTVRFSVDGGAMTYRVHTDTEDNPFSGGLFSQFGLSDTLY